MCTRVIGSGLRLLIAAVLSLLLAFPPAAHPGHGHDTTALMAVAAVDTLVDRTSSGNVDKGVQVIAVPAPALVSSSCCCGQSGCCANSSYGLGMTCGSGSCGHSGSALVVSQATHGATKRAACLPNVVFEISATSDHALPCTDNEPRGCLHSPAACSGASCAAALPACPFLMLYPESVTYDPAAHSVMERRVSESLFHPPRSRG